MVLKIGNGTEWSYVGDISSIHVTSHDESQNASPNAEGYFYPSSKDGPPSIVKDIAVHNHIVSTPKYLTVTAPFIYLMSDEGKTIERIN